MPGIFEGAKKAKEKALEKTGELTQQASDKADELRAKTVEASVTLKDQLSASDMTDAGVAKLTEVVKELNAASPVLTAAGYQLVGMVVKLGFPPEFSVDFEIAGDVSDEKINALIEEHAERKMTVLLVKSLTQAKKLQSKIKVVGLEPQRVSVGIGLIPEVGVKFGRPREW